MRERFATLGRAWLLATKLLKSSKNICIWDPWRRRTTTWVRRYRGESRRQIDASSDCATNCSRGICHVQQNSSSTRPWSARSCCMAVRHGGQLLVGPKLENGVYRRRYNFDLQKEFDSPCVINIVKTNRLRYAGLMIKRPEDLPQKAIFIARPQGTRQREDQNPGGRMGWTAKAGSLGPQIGRTELKIKRNGENFLDRPWQQTGCK
jgi:hypothetical protein